MCSSDLFPSHDMRAVGGNIGVVVQLQVFKNGIPLDKEDFKGYIAEKIEEHIRECL